MDRKPYGTCRSWRQTQCSTAVIDLWGPRSKAPSWHDIAMVMMLKMRTRRQLREDQTRSRCRLGTLTAKRPMTAPATTIHSAREKYFSSYSSNTPCNIRDACSMTSSAEICQNVVTACWCCFPQCIKVNKANRRRVSAALKLAQTIFAMHVL